MNNINITSASHIIPMNTTATNAITVTGSFSSAGVFSGGAVTSTSGQSGQTVQWAAAPPRWRMVLGLEMGTDKYITKSYESDTRYGAKNKFIDEHPTRIFLAIFIID